jgi:cytochrome P450
MERINLFSPEMRADPYPSYAEMRRSSPVCKVEPIGCWAVSRYEDAVYVLKENGLFSAAGIADMIQNTSVGHNPICDSMVVMDPPTHTKLRALVSRAFSAAVIPRIEPIARAAAAEGAEQLRTGDFVDFFKTFSVPVAASVIANLLGLDPALRDSFMRWSAHIVSINPAMPPERTEEVRESVTTLKQYLTEVIAARRKEPKGDLVSDLIAAEIDGQALTHVELMGFLFLLLVAGLETTSHLLTNAVRVLVRSRDLHDRIRKDPTLIPAFVDEVLRFDPPVYADIRLTTAEVQVGGTTIPAGSLVTVLLASVNRDERLFEDPDTFNIDRRRQTGFSFTYGIHFCLGAALARAEARVALEALCSLPGYFDEQPGDQEWAVSATVRGLLRYPVRLVAA